MAVEACWAAELKPGVPALPPALRASALTAPQRADEAASGLPLADLLGARLHDALVHAHAARSERLQGSLSGLRLAALAVHCPQRHLSLSNALCAASYPALLLA